MTFLERLQSHVGGLIKFKLTDESVGGHSSLNGKVGMICALSQQVSSRWAWVTLLIDGNARETLLHESEAEFL